jgi:hypothetical protein
MPGVCDRDEGGGGNTNGDVVVLVLIDFNDERFILASILFPLYAGLCRPGNEGVFERETGLDVKIFVDRVDEPNKASSSSRSAFNTELPLLRDDISALDGGGEDFGCSREDWIIVERASLSTRSCMPSPTVGTRSERNSGSSDESGMVWRGLVLLFEREKRLRKRDANVGGGVDSRGIAG